MRLSRRDLQESLNALPAPTLSPGGGRTARPVSRGRKQAKAAPTPIAPKRRRRWLRRLIVLIIIAVIAVVGYIGIKAYLVSHNLLNGGSILSLFEPGTPLATDTQGRTNILVFGTSQDDASHQNAEGGGGLWLTDSIQLVSIDQKNKTIKMVAIPRDLWVKTPDCPGYAGKINSIYECSAGLSSSTSTTSSGYAGKDKNGAQALMDKVATVTGITPQYYIHADYSVLRQAVDAVGGIDVNIVGDGASGIYDTNFDWNCPNGPYTCKNVYYPSNGTYRLNGTQALYLARARGDAGAYSYKDFGLSQGDFDRQANQQKILTALQAKINSAGVLANPFALNGLIDALGSNLSTSLSGGEVKTLLSDMKQIPNGSLQSVSLVAKGTAVVRTATISGQSVVVPTSGTYDYSSISDYLATQLAVPKPASSNSNQ